MSIPTLGDGFLDLFHMQNYLHMQICQHISTEVPDLKMVLVTILGNVINISVFAFVQIDGNKTFNLFRFDILGNRKSKPAKKTAIYINI